MFAKPQVEAVLEFAIVDLMGFINVSRTMNEYQIKETARLILQRYAYLTIPDIKLVFDRIKCGTIKLYEGLDGHKILGAFEMWAEERWRAADEYNYSKHITNTGNEKRKRDKPFMFGGDSLGDSPREVADEKYFEKK